jgi:predicted nucleic-acid-binding Zn-ribbon protein
MWECVKCHERHDDSFEICWNCGTSRAGVEDPTFTKVEDEAKPSGSEAQALTAVPSREHSQRPAPARALLWEACPKCGSRSVLPGGELKPAADPGSLQVVFFKRPNQVFFPGPVRGDLRAYVCGDCGYTELYVQNPQAVAQALPRGETQEQA